MSRQNFSTRDISRYEWGATGTIFPSSCYPVSFFAVARPRDLSFAAARFQSPLSFFLALSLFFSSASVQRNAVASAHCSCVIRAAKPFLDQLSRSTSLPGIFSLRARESGGLGSSSEAVQVNLREHPRLHESTFLLQFVPNLGLSRRDLDYPRYYTAAHFSRTIDSTSRQHVSRVVHPMGVNH